MICPVCKQKLINKGRIFQCENNHSYDIGKSGYINLLLNCKNSGDNKQMVQARHQFLQKDYYLPLKQKINEIIASLKIDSILDVGCGDGYFDVQLNNLYGIDISKEAIIKASKNNKNAMYVVASGFDIPFEDNSISLILNIFAPHDEKEFTRVSNNYILKVVPGKNHLLELKKVLYDKVVIKEEKHLCFKAFSEIGTYHLTYQVCVADLYELVMMTPYFYTSSINKELLECYANTSITCDFTILLYKKII